MQARALAARDRLVRHVADQRVLEAVAASAAMVDEVAIDEVAQPAGRAAAAAVQERLELLEREAPPDDGGALEQPLVLGDRAGRAGRRSRPAPSRARGRRRRPRRSSPGSPRGRTGSRRPGRRRSAAGRPSRPARSRAGASRPASSASSVTVVSFRMPEPQPGWFDVELGARDAHHHERHAHVARHDRRDQLEQRRLGPVGVLDHEQRGLARGHAQEQSAPGVARRGRRGSSPSIGRLHPLAADEPQELGDLLVAALRAGSPGAGPSPGPVSPRGSRPRARPPPAGADREAARTGRPRRRAGSGPTQTAGGSSDRRSSTTASSTSRDFPIPASPISVRRWARECSTARSTTDRISVSSTSRPTNGPYGPPPPAVRARGSEPLDGIRRHRPGAAADGQRSRRHHAHQRLDAPGTSARRPAPRPARRPAGGGPRG